MGSLFVVVPRRPRQLRPWITLPLSLSLSLTDRLMSRSTEGDTFTAMSSKKFTDEYGFTGPLPTTSSQRVVPTGDFRPGLSVGELAPDFELPNHRGEIVSFHADRNGVRTALLFYRSVVW